MARRRRYYNIEGQLTFDDLLAETEGAKADERVRDNGQAALGAVAASEVRGDQRPGQLLLLPWPAGGGEDRGPDAGPGRGRPAGRGLPGQAGPAERGPRPGPRDRPGGDPARTGTGRRGPADGSSQPAAREPAAGLGAEQPAQPGIAGFRPASQADLAPSGQVARVRANLAAVATLKSITGQDRAATPDEQTVLARWSGWGAVPEVFDPGKDEFAWAREELGRLLIPAELAAAARNTLNAHYTDAAIARAVWDGVTGLGFAGGRVLEPGCGSGNFIGLAPPGAEMTGVELDPVTAGVAAALYPGARILAESFADTRIPRDTFDLAVGNVPFGAIVLHDPAHNRAGHSIHNHFIVKALALTRPGGLVALLTSRYTMDTRNPAARREIAALADLAGAVRLPSGAHQRAAGTSVVTDLLIFRRREPGAEPGPLGWEQARMTELDSARIAVNSWFLDHPEMVLGRMRATGGAYGADDMTVEPAGDTITELDRALAEITSNARQDGLTWTPAAGTPAAPAVIASAADRERYPDGFMRVLADGVFTRVVDGTAVRHPVPASQAGELRQLLGLRDTVRALLEAETASPDDTPALGQLRRDLNQRYDAYAAAYGPVNRFAWRRTGRPDPGTGEEGRARIRPPQGGFRTDPFAPAVLALEHFDPATQHAAKAAIFTRRVVAPRNPRLGASTPADALAICLDLCGEVRLPVISRLLGIAEGEGREMLGTLVFDDPESGRLLPAAEYLSGKVRAKLATAEVAAADDPRFEVNAAGLRKVIPPDLGPAEIEARLGATWIDADYVRRFLAEILEDDTIRVEHPGGQIWAVRGGRHSVLAASTWGTGRYSAPGLAQAILEQRRIEVRDQIDEKTWVLNPDETIAAQQKAAELAARFAEWAWEEPARAAELAAAYNSTFNGIVLRNYDEVELSLPGLALDFEPRPHQIAAVARMISEPAVLLAHEVGAGKTAEMVMGAMELRRLGLVRKPAIIVPNHMLEQFSREFAQLYPQASILIAHREDLQAARRRVFIGRAATGDWDAIIMSRSAFERIPMSPAAQRAYQEQELDRLRAWIDKAKGGEGLTVKRLEATLLRAEERLKSLLDKPRDPGVTFEATGIDYVILDEAHAYKNLRTASRIGDAAIDGSSRASDLDMKLSYLRERNGHRVATFATATPIANSITEAHVMQRYLRPDLLTDAGIGEFDSWAATFAEQVTQIELAPEGGSSFRQKTRFARFVNVPEMLKIWHVSADVKTADDLNLPVPDLARRPADGQRLPETVVVAPTDELIDYVASLGERAEDIRNRAVSPEEDNMLKVSGDGRKAALDMRLAGVPMTAPGKINAAAARIAAIWSDHRDDTYPAPGGGDMPRRGSLQLVFSDLGTPSGQWNAYDELRDQLTSLGMPRETIRFIHEAGTDEAKAELFDACRTGAVAVIVGSTEKMGVGTNVQARAIALHHLDCPWRPADVAQREGRILRQGNQNPEIAIIRYVTEQSFDGYMWQAVERKSRFIGQVMRGRLDVREIEEIGDASLSYSEVKALATGNPLLMEKAEADAELTKLQRAERGFLRDQEALQHTITSGEQRITALTALSEEITLAITRRRDTRGEAFTMTIDGTRYSKRHDAGQRLAGHLTSQLAALARNNHPSLASQPGHLGGFDLAVTVRRVLGTTEAVIAFDGAPGAELRLSPADITTTDPGKLAIRLENRLASLETQHAKTLADIDRLRGEADHARDGLGKPFPRADQLNRARERSDAINQQLQEAATAAADTPAAAETTSGYQPEGAAPASGANQLTTSRQLAQRSFPVSNPLSFGARSVPPAEPEVSGSRTSSLAATPRRPSSNR